jgi:16S rRNA (cytosine967-C5)-methyltransferase
VQRKLKEKKSEEPTVSPARRAAFDALMAVEGGHAHSDELLRGKAVSALAAADRNLATALVLGVLRWQIRLDEQIKGFLKRPGARLDAEIGIALRLGAFQLLHLDRVPVHAAIDESVELAKRAGHGFAARMVNAVLRRMASKAEEEQRFNNASNDSPSGARALDCPLPMMYGLKRVPSMLTPKSFRDAGPSGFNANSVAELALSYAHPAWMVERWVEFYGLEVARAICAHGQTQPVGTVRLESEAVEAGLASAGVELAPGELLSAAHAVVAGDVISTAAFREGRVRLQDEGSQLIGEIAAFAAADANKKTRNILDMCAAPGGKTLILAERNPGARIVACEANAQRLAALRERLGALGERVECRLADAAALDEDSAFDVVLADVPCSGTGTLGRNPEIRHRLRAEDLARQAERQRAILRAALRAVRPGGVVVYSTCSLEPEENERVVGTVLAEDAMARVIPVGTGIEALDRDGILAAGAAERLRRCVTAEGALRLLPGDFGTDGFFVVMIQRTA